MRLKKNFLILIVSVLTGTVVYGFLSYFGLEMEAKIAVSVAAGIVAGYATERELSVINVKNNTQNSK